MVTLPPDTERAIASIQAGHRSYLARQAEIAADHEAANAENAERDEAAAHQRHVEYRAYLCSMSDHGCLCVALTFEEWAALPAEAAEQVRS